MTHQPGLLQRAALVAVAILACGTMRDPAAAQAPAATPSLTSAQLEQLVAPIALYPDSLLTQVLMASTYPLEVVEAARWARDHAQVTGPELESAMQQQPWDPSVKALTAIPQTLKLMNDKLEWTQQLGDAFLAQDAELLDAVQRLRARADANGQLKTTEQQRVTKLSTPPQGSGQRARTEPVYTIEPATAGTYYVPIYDPGVVFGDWPYPDYAPFYWYPPGYAASGAFSFAAGVITGAAIWGHADWWRRRVNVNVVNFNRFNRTNIVNADWRHNPLHRGGVPYRDAGVTQRFGGENRAVARDAARQKLGTGAAGAGARSKAAGRAGAAKAKAGAARAGATKAGAAKSRAVKSRAAKAGTAKARARTATVRKNVARSKVRSPARQRHLAGPGGRINRSAFHGRAAATPRFGGMHGGGRVMHGGGRAMRGGGGFRRR
jgi:hypothetical protein